MTPAVKKLATGEKHIQARSKYSFALVRPAARDFVQRPFFQGEQSLDLRPTLRDHRRGEDEPKAFDVLMKNKFSHDDFSNITGDNNIR